MISLTSPVKTRAHDWPAGAILIALCVATVLLFFVNGLLAQSIILLSVLLLYASFGRTFFVNGLQKLRILWPFVAIIAIWHVWTGEVVEGLVIILRMVSAFALANLVTMTTRLSDMMDVLRRVLQPLERFGVQTKAVELSIALVIRLTPVLISKGSNLSQAWRARATKRAGWRTILPFTILALDDADYVAEALQARGGIIQQKEI